MPRPATTDLDDEDDIVRDGETVRVRATLMDAAGIRAIRDKYAPARQQRVTDALGQPAGHKPGHLFLSAPQVHARIHELRDQGEQARAERIAAAADMWRHDPMHDQLHQKAASAGPRQAQDARDALGTTRSASDPSARSGGPQAARDANEAWEMRRRQALEAWR